MEINKRKKIFHWYNKMSEEMSERARRRQLRAELKQLIANRAKAKEAEKFAKRAATTALRLF
ncbi:hypothetical protein, partial [Burkholderia cenocepacia]|uniref:hypothetical protein n=1 Tax=Burkholderia cenocepacia TaxID=95486 RepID=UPI002237B107